MSKSGSSGRGSEHPKAPKRTSRSVRPPPKGSPAAEGPAPEPQEKVVELEPTEIAEAASEGTASDEEPTAGEDEVAEVGEVVASGDVAPFVDEPLDDEEGGAWPSGGRETTALAPVDRGSTALSRRDPYQAYLREVQRYPLLTAEQETELTRRYHETGDVNVAARLVTANLRLVIKIAYEYRRAYRNIMDLIQA
jgi:RNA polymerase sigma-32 factor